MNILITGANGFLGHYLVRDLLQKKYTVIATGKGDCRLPFMHEIGFIYAAMDFTDPFAVHDIFEKYKPEIIIHAGAISKPDECENNQWRAYVVNVEGTLHLLLNAELLKCFFIFLSTDFVFNGENGPYKENDVPAPVNFYGKTKLEAEEAVNEFASGWAIVRTILVYGKTYSIRGNLLTVVKEKLEKGEEYSVFNDQLRTPTYIEDLSSAIVSIVKKEATGIFHISGKDLLTPYQMACSVADYLGLNKNLIKKVDASDFKQPAKRPPRTGFIIEKAEQILNYKPVSFEEGVRRTFQ